MAINILLINYIVWTRIFNPELFLVQELMFIVATTVHRDLRVPRVAWRRPALCEAAAHGSGAGRIPQELPARASCTAAIRPVAHHSAWPHRLPKGKPRPALTLSKLFYLLLWPFEDAHTSTYSMEYIAHCGLSTRIVHNTQSKMFTVYLLWSCAEFRCSIYDFCTILCLFSIMLC